MAAFHKGTCGEVAGCQTDLGDRFAMISNNPTSIFKIAFKITAGRWIPGFFPSRNLRRR